MPRIIFKCPYIKPGTERAAAHLNNYVRYVATRDGTDLLKPDKAGQPATKKTAGHGGAAPPGLSHVPRDV